MGPGGGDKIRNKGPLAGERGLSKKEVLNN